MTILRLAVLGTAAALTLSGCGSTDSYDSGGYRSSTSAGIATQGDEAWFRRLVGAADDGAATQLGINGFRQVDSFSSGNNGYGTVWYNNATGQCLQVITVNGRVDSSVDIQTHPRCRG